MEARSSRVWLLVALAWLGAAALGLHWLLAYSLAAGAAATTPTRWPADAPSGLSRATDRPTLFVFVHPHCPCSRATVQQLAAIVAHCDPQRLAVRVIAIKSAGVPDGWEQTSLLSAAREIPGVEVVVDRDGVAARRFGAETSGHALLYGAGGELMFGGGITASRGHLGDNAGNDAIVALVNRAHSDTRQTPVFGCPLTSASSSSSSSLRSSPQSCETGGVSCPK